MTESPTEGAPEGGAEEPETTTEQGGGLTREEANNLWMRTLDH
ncbi:hypothetical protein SAMN05421837_107386 [Amycolatopsis pretoriensis]|uniref:Uncharacterized protein n=1 Tax=Amycolatopsis pretoriensis TaxID=218821 RepID=A0A1H5R7R3_9PSEU|nr:hypothetical protein [Amycolatopsis pretoriensis]SEF34432.1 hypothetical protein SAMN05421837_107386 [Amycolatopsis pretoriensis]